MMAAGQADRDEFLRLAEEVSTLCIDVPEEDLVLMLAVLRQRLTVDLSDQLGSIAAALQADAIVATVFRRRQEILAPVVN